MRHICLEPDVRAIDGLQGIDHGFPALHPAPADFTFRSERFTIIGGNVTGFPKGLGYQFGICAWVGCPAFRVYGRIDANHAIRPNTQFTQFLSDFAGFAYLGDKLLPFFGGTHGGTSTYTSP